MGAVAARSRARGGAFMLSAGEGIGIGGASSALSFLWLFVIEGRRPLVEKEGCRSRLSDDIDFDRGREFASEVFLPKGEGPGECLEDLALLPGDTGLLPGSLSLLLFDLVSFFESLTAVVGKGGKAQSRLINSGEGAV
jgi:hypothetical protein